MCLCLFVFCVVVSCENVCVICFVLLCSCLCVGLCCECVFVYVFRVVYYAVCVVLCLCGWMFVCRRFVFGVCG